MSVQRRLRHLFAYILISSLFGIHGCSTISYENSLYGIFCIFNLLYACHRKERVLVISPPRYFMTQFLRGKYLSKET